MSDYGVIPRSAFLLLIMQSSASFQAHLPVTSLIAKQVIAKSSTALHALIFGTGMGEMCPKLSLLREEYQQHFTNNLVDFYRAYAKINS